MTPEAAKGAATVTINVSLNPSHVSHHIKSSQRSTTHGFLNSEYSAMLKCILFCYWESSIKFAFGAPFDNYALQFSRHQLPVVETNRSSIVQSNYQLYTVMDVYVKLYNVMYKQYNIHLLMAFAWFLVLLLFFRPKAEIFLGSQIG